MSDSSRQIDPLTSADDFQQGITADTNVTTTAEPTSSDVRSLPIVPELTPFTLPNLGDEDEQPPQQPIDFLRDVELNLNVELGRTQLDLEEVRRLRAGTVVALDRRTSEPVDVVVNGQLVARGEVIVMDGKLCVRVTEVISGEAA